MMGGLRFILRDAASDFTIWLVAALPRHAGFPWGCLKAWILRAWGAIVGIDVHIYPGVRIYVPGPCLVIGSHVSISSYTIITTAGGVRIGNNVLIGYGSCILSANHTIPSNRAIIYGFGHTCAAVTIEDEVWIGAHCVILPGVRLGRGCVIAAGAVVTKDVEPYTIMAGVPARVLRSRD